MQTIDVLVIDDEIEISEMFVKVLTKLGLTVVSANSAREALDFISHTTPPLILCDISMPGMTGLQFIEEARRASYTCAIVVITAHDDRDMILEALRLGATDYLLKPVDIPKFMEDARIWLEMGKRLQKMEKDHEGDPAFQKQTKMMNMFRLKNSNSKKVS